MGKLLQTCYRCTCALRTLFQTAGRTQKTACCPTKEELAQTRPVFIWNSVSTFIDGQWVNGFIVKKRGRALTL